MKTYQISKDDIKGLEVLAEGYKAVKWDLSTNGDKNFRYGNEGENLIGTVWEVDEDIKKCNWGLHFSKNPAHVFNFYEPLGYNRYFKVRAYKETKESETGKTVAKCIEFVEEYDLMQFIKIIGRYGGEAVRGSNAVSCSNAVSHSNAVGYSEAVRGSNAVSYSNAVSHSNAVGYSEAVRGSNAVIDSKAVSYSNAVIGSYAIKQCEAVKNCIFCYKKEAVKYYIFNKKVKKERFDEVYRKILAFNFKPEYMNWNEIKGNREWWAFNFEKLKANENSWASMPEKMKEYLKSMPEFNKKVFKEITGLEG